MESTKVVLYHPMTDCHCLTQRWTKVEFNGSMQIIIVARKHKFNK